MARGLHKLTDVANTLQAREDWEKLALQAVGLGWEEYQINKYAPHPQDGWRKIDRCIARLRKALEANSK
jgi:hypothetical protein